LASFFRNKWVRRLGLLVFALVALIYGNILLNYPTCTFRYKLTAEVMTPEGLKSGSSVIEVSYSHFGGTGGGDSADLNMTGEAAYVDLGQGKNLFITLRAHESGREQSLGRNYDPLRGALDGYAAPLKAFGLKWSFGKERELCAAVDKLAYNTAFPLSFENVPTLVSFKNLNDGNSVSVVQPTELDSVFGPSFKLQTVKLEHTKAMPTEFINRTLPWLEKKRPRDGGIRWRLSDPLIDRLHYTSFKMPI
jgi:hypothetical protein